jgi:hypothetical protein
MLCDHYFSSRRERCVIVSSAALEAALRSVYMQPWRKKDNHHYSTRNMECVVWSLITSHHIHSSLEEWSVIISARAMVKWMITCNHPRQGLSLISGIMKCEHFDLLTRFNLLWYERSPYYLALYNMYIHYAPFQQENLRDIQSFTGFVLLVYYINDDHSFISSIYSSDNNRVINLWYLKSAIINETSFLLYYRKLHEVS